MRKEEDSWVAQANIMITITQEGSFKNTERFLNNIQKERLRSLLPKYGSAGVLALSKATPVQTGLTASSWEFVTEVTSWGYAINWFNSNRVGSVNIAIILQYGHGTGTGGYVQGRDYINPAMRPVFDKMAEDIWKEVRNL